MIALAGPTAVGKTHVSMLLAEKLNCPVLSADSRQIYKELSIGTAKPPAKELKRIRHFFIDTRSIREPYSAGDYERDFLALTEELFRTFNALILCGGTGLYFKAALEGLDTFPSIPTSVRQKWSRKYKEFGIDYLQDALRKADPDYAKGVDLQNHLRLIRALAVSEVASRPYSSFLGESKQQRSFQSIPILLERPRTELYQRIDERVDRMMEAGLLEEVKGLTGYKGHQALQTVGYKELFDYLESRYSLEEAIARIKQHTRNYAKRQLTWFRNQGNFTSFHPEDINGIMAFIKKHMGT